MNKEVVESLENAIIAGEEILGAFRQLNRSCNFDRLELTSNDSREEYDELDGYLDQLCDDLHNVLGILENMRDREKGE